MQVASLNLATFTKLFEKKQIDQFAKLLKKEQIDILAVQGVTRYPGIERHVDFVNELVARSEMRQVFGEMFNNAGRQSGNGIFSVYPLRNNHNEPFDGVKSALFEAALATSVDRGIKDVVVVSATLPPKAPESDQSKCLRIISDKGNAGTNRPMVVTGNLPSSVTVRESGRFLDVVSSDNAIGGKNPATKIWYTDDGSLKVLGVRTVETEFGTMLVAQFGLFQ
jgi:endonuclease/exonuclease/phosphatase family metal-dependent hydrolase